MIQKTMIDERRERRHHLWRMRGCVIPGCQAYAATACGGWINDEHGGSECRRPVCIAHIGHQTAELDLCAFCAGRSDLRHRVAHTTPSPHQDSLFPKGGAPSP